MPSYFAFLRGINLGRRRIKMADLRACFVELKFAHVESFIASGNIRFDSPERDPARLERKIEAHLEKNLGYKVDTFVRTRDEVAAVAAFRPFAPADLEAPSNTVSCSFLKQPLTAAQTHGLLACRTESDELRTTGREIYWLCRIRSNESKIWTSAQMRTLRLPSSTMRNLTTIGKLAALYPVVA